MDPVQEPVKPIHAGAGLYFWFLQNQKCLLEDKGGKEDPDMRGDRAAAD